jgi:hypothetical protein
MRPELPNYSHLSPRGRRLCDGHHHGSNSRHGTDVRVRRQHRIGLLLTVCSANRVIAAFLPSFVSIASLLAPLELECR